MRRIHPVLLVIILLLCIGVGFFVIVRPPLVLRVASPESIRVFQERINVRELDVVLKTNGRIAVTADGQQLAYMTYDLGTLKNAADIADKTMITSDVRRTTGILTFMFPQLTSNLLVTGLSLYNWLPMEIGVRFTRG